MEPRFIIVWGSEPGAGRRTVSQALAEKLDALYVNVAPFTPAHGTNPGEWVPRFQTLSPLMLRNYLKCPAEAGHRLDLNGFPDERTLRDLMALLQNAFEWIVWTSPVDWSAESLAVLDRAQLLLWVTSDRRNLESHFAKLSAAHYPRALSRIILNQVSEQTLQTGDGILSQIPMDSPRGIPFRQGLQTLVDLLRARQDIYINRDETTASSAETWVEDLKNRVKPQLMESNPSAAAPPVELAQKTLDTCLADDSRLPASREQRTEIYTRVLEDVLGLGPLEPFLRDPDVSEVMVNGAGSVFLEKKGKLFPAGVHFSNDGQLRTVIDRIVAPIGRRVDESSPLCDARLADGSRVNIVLPPLALDGPALTIRKFMARALTLKELVEWGSLSSEMCEFLSTAVRQRRNIVVAGGTGSGKTTLLNALSGMIPDDERIVTIEDAAELRLQKPHVVRLESRPPNTEGEGAIPIRRLVINALRMRPDRIVIGECRGGEALDMLQAMNTGHDGSLTTLHANSCRDALRRLETLVLMAGIDLPVRVVREQIQSAVHILVHQSRLADGARKVVSITELTGMEGDVLTTQEIFRFRNGQFENTGIMPHLGRPG